MAITTTPAAAGYGDVGNTDTTIFSGDCMTFWIKVSGNSSESLLVCVTSLHGNDTGTADDSWLRLEAGDYFVTRDSTLSGMNNISEVRVKSASATEATFSWAVAASGSD